jgi:hypothetical protein
LEPGLRQRLAIIAETLIAIGFRGFLSIEQDKHPGDMKATCARYVRMMKEYLGA